MKLTVCIFTYNHAAYIRQAIDSVLMQRTNFEYEIFISDDCSTDGTADIIREYHERYPNKIRMILHPKNLGIMQNNAFVLGQSLGEYVSLLDGDDYWIYDGKLQSQVDFLDEHREYVLSFHDGMILWPNGSFDRKTCCGSDQKRYVTFADIICDTHIPTFSIVFRRSALCDFPPVGYFNLRSPDRPVFLLLAAKGPGYYFNERWAVYRKHAAGCWTGKSFQYQWTAHLAIYRTVDAHFKGRHRRAFSRCERRVTYILAMAFLQNLQYRRAACYFRKYLRRDKGHLSSRMEAYFKVIQFVALYVAKKIRYKLS